MSTPGATFTVTAETMEAIRDFTKFMNTVNESARSVETLNKRGRESKSAFDELGKTVLQVAAGFGFVTSVSSGIDKLVSMTKEWIEYQKQLRVETEKVADSMIALARLEAPGSEGAIGRWAATMGANYGMKSTDAISQFTSIQRYLGGSAPRAQAIAPEFWAAVESGVMTPETGLSAIRYGVNVGDLTEQEALNIPRLATSAINSSDSIAAAMTRSDSFGKGLQEQAKWAALIGMVSPGDEDLSSATQRLASTIFTDEGDLGKLWRKLGVSGKQLEGKGVAQKEWDDARLKALHDAGYTTEVALQDFGVSGRNARLLGSAAAAYGSDEYNARLNKIITGADAVGEVGGRFQQNLESLESQGIYGPSQRAIGQRSTADIDRLLQLPEKQQATREAIEQLDNEIAARKIFLQLGSTAHGMTKDETTGRWQSNAWQEFWTQSTFDYVPDLLTASDERKKNWGRTMWEKYDREANDTILQQMMSKLDEWKKSLDENTAATRGNSAATRQENPPENRVPAPSPGAGG